MLHEILNNIKNRARIFKKDTYVKNSKFNLSILNKLVETGHLESIKEVDTYWVQTIIRFPYKMSTFKDLQMISTPGRRLYVTVSDLPSYIKDKRTIILSTNKGILTHREAFKLNVGGVVLFKI